MDIRIYGCLNSCLTSYASASPAWPAMWGRRRPLARAPGVEGAVDRPQQAPDRQRENKFVTRDK